MRLGQELGVVKGIKYRGGVIPDNSNRGRVGDGRKLRHRICFCIGGILVRVHRESKQPQPFHKREDDSKKDDQ